MADSQTYSNSDIRRYLQRKMSQREMHDFEKALMDDPFLADAIEGYSNSDPALAERHLSAIESELGGIKETAKVVPLSVQKNHWWKVAAIVLVVITGSAVAYSLINKNTLAENNAEQVTGLVKTENARANDSIGPVEKPLARIDVLPGKDVANQQVRPPFKSDPSPREKQSKGSGAIAEPPGNTASASVALTGSEPGSSAVALRAAAADNHQVMSETKTMSLPAGFSQQEFKGKVLDKTGEPLAFATVRALKEEVGTIADAKGNFTLKAPDTVMEVKVVSVGYAAATFEIRSNKPVNEIMLEEEKTSLADVVVTKLQSKKERRNAVYAHQASGAEPVGGWKSFEQYAQRQVDSLKAANNVQMDEEDVELEFSIDKEGRPTDIKAAKPIDKSFAEKAVQILSNGPKWENRKKEKKVKVIIPF